MDQNDSLLFTCPKCGIMITVTIGQLQERVEFPCSICSEMIFFDIPPEDLERIYKESVLQQQKDLKRSFRLAFGDV